MKYILTTVIILFLSTGCTKKEFKTNFHNIKEDFSEHTEKYKED
ncbi:hypothetical protein [Sulfurimonas sp. CS5]|jgi:hypothetical protein